MVTIFSRITNDNGVLRKSIFQPMKCICVKDNSTFLNLNLHTCKTDCIKDYKTPEGCGDGHSVFTVYLSSNLFLL